MPQDSTSASSQDAARQRAWNELQAARLLFRLSERPDVQKSLLEREPLTFYSGVISHAYYSIFYVARAYLQTRGVTTRPPREHEQVYERFAWFVETGVLDKELLRIYDAERPKAAVLLGILGDEKSKRGRFTYRTLPQANKRPAEESIAHATTFFKRLANLCE